MKRAARVLIVAATIDARRHLERMVRALDHRPHLVRDVADALLHLVEAPVDLVLVEDADPAGPVAELALLGPPVLALHPDPSTRLREAARAAGARDLIPLRDRRAFRDAVEVALQAPRAGAQETADASVRRQEDREALVSQSPRMLEVFDQIQAVARTDATVLVRGETGTGKERISQAIHSRSARSDKPMISVNCGAFAESLLESELFGHEKGAFTGAAGQRAGVFEMADGGTLFLDELGETSLNVQVSLLRVLEDFQFRRVGGRELVDVDVRIVAATNVALEAAVEEKRFREDLYFRLNVFPITLPPLRERPEDIPLLMRTFLAHFAESYGLEVPSVSAEAMEAILRYRWPGNIRQLRAMCERWVIVRSGERIEAADLDPRMLQIRHSSRAEPLAIHDELSLKANTQRVVEQLERTYLYRQLRRHQGHLARTAEASGITRRTLYTKMRQYDLDAADFRGPET
jgi:two-component system response regulator AtoC